MLTRAGAAAARIVSSVVTQAAEQPVHNIAEIRTTARVPCISGAFLIIFSF
jgi:hypothetical protein